MTIPSSTVRLTDIQNEFGGPTPIQLGNYYRGGSYVNTNISGPPYSGAIGMLSFRGVTNRVNLTVTNNDLLIDYVLYPYYIPGYVAGITTVNFVNNYIMGASSTSSYALRIFGFTSGDSVTITNNSWIVGAGGAGGRGSAAGNYPDWLPLPGEAGGPAVYCTYPVTFINNAYVGGGGGGGGGGQSNFTKYSDNLGGGGGGGQGYYPGAGGPAFYYPPWTAYPGSAGTYYSPGAGGSGSQATGSNFGYTGGSGGGLGSAGATGNGVQYGYPGGAGGAGGICLIGLQYVNGGGGIYGAAYGPQYYV
jgi:hypothetical protein